MDSSFIIRTQVCSKLSLRQASRWMPLHPSLAMERKLIQWMILLSSPNQTPKYMSKWIVHRKARKGNSVYRMAIKRQAVLTRLHWTIKWWMYRRISTRSTSKTPKRPSIGLKCTRLSACSSCNRWAVLLIRTRRDSSPRIRALRKALTSRPLVHRLPQSIGNPTQLTAFWLNYALTTRIGAKSPSRSSIKHCANSKVVPIQTPLK